MFLQMENVKHIIINIKYVSFYYYNSLSYFSYSSDIWEEKPKNCNQYKKGTGKNYCTSLKAEN